MLGNFIQTQEMAHPFRIESDSIACAFVEYSDFSDSSGIKIRNICANLMSEMHEITQEQNYNQALSKFLISPSYMDARSQITNEFFWEIGKYTVDIVVEYGKQNIKNFLCEFSVSEQDYFKLQKNIDEILIAQLKLYYHVKPDFYYPMIEISSRE